MVEEKNVGIFDLYTREKLIFHTDTKGRKVEMFLVKMTQRERSKSLEIYFQEKEKEEKRLREEEEKNGTLSKTIGNLTKEQIVRGILDYEEPQRSRSADLYPFENEEKLTPEEKEKEKQRLIGEWRKERKETLESETIDELKKRLLEINFEGLSLLEGGRKLDYATLFFMCRDSKTKNKIFKSFEDVEEVRDRRVLDWLMKELQNFRKEELSEDEIARQEAKSPDFLPSGGSPKPLEETQPSVA